MQIKILTSAFVTLLLISSQTFSSPGEDVLDDLTMRVFTNENMSDSVQLIALPNIRGEHNVNHPDAADNGGGQGGGGQGGGGQGGGDQGGGDQGGGDQGGGDQGGGGKGGGGKGGGGKGGGGKGGGGKGQ